MRRINLIKNQLSNKLHSYTSYTSVESVDNNPGIKIVTFDNPPLNALGLESSSALYEILSKLDADQETRVIIITGKGRAFVAGADIKAMSQLNYSEMSKIQSFLFNVEKISYHITKPLIAAVNGFTFGGGFELALCCDLIVASDKASFAFPELKLGLFPGAGGTQRISKIIGPVKAMEYILTCKDIPLSELKSLGVINDIVPHDQLINKCVQLAENISKFSLTSVSAAKKAIKISQETGLYAGLRTEKYLFDGLFNTEDKQIGLNAFINKKSPIFKDK